MFGVPVRLLATGLRKCDSSLVMSLSTLLRAVNRLMEPLSSSFKRTADAAEYDRDGDVEIRE